MNTKLIKVPLDDGTYLVHNRKHEFIVRPNGLGGWTADYRLDETGGLGLDGKEIRGASEGTPDGVIEFLGHILDAGWPER